MAKRTAEEADIATRTPIQYKAPPPQPKWEHSVEKLFSAHLLHIDIYRDRDVYAVDYLQIEGVPDRVAWANSACIDATSLREHAKSQPDGWHVDITWHTIIFVPTIAENTSYDSLRAKALELSAMIKFETFVPSLKTLAVKRLFKCTGGSLALLISRMCGGSEVLAIAAADRPDQESNQWDVDRDGLDKSLSQWFGRNMLGIYHSSRTTTELQMIEPILASGAHAIAHRYKKDEPEEVVYNDDGW